MIRVLEAAAVERSIKDLAPGTIVVVCDPDADAAAVAASRLTELRTAVFIGDITNDEDRIAVQEFAAETFSNDGEVVF